LRVITFIKQKREESERVRYIVDLHFFRNRHPPVDSRDFGGKNGPGRIQKCRKRFVRILQRRGFRLHRVCTRFIRILTAIFPKVKIPSILVAPLD